MPSPARRSRWPASLVAAILASLVTLAPVRAALGASLAPLPDVLQGIPYAPELLRNLSYGDTRGHWAEQAITRAGALGIIQGRGARRFAPEGPVTKEEALAILARAVSAPSTPDQAAATAAQLEKDGVKMSPWAMAEAQRMIDAGLIGREDLKKDDWTAPARRDEVAFWLAKALKLDPVPAESQQAVYSFDDWREIAQDRLPLVEGVLQARLMAGAAPGSFRPAAPLRRAEIAAILDRLEPRVLGVRGYRSEAATVLDVRSERLAGALDSAGDVVRTTVYLRSRDGSTRRIVAEREVGGYPARLAGGSVAVKDSVVLKGGALGLLETLAPGDQVRAIVAAGDQVPFVEVLGTSAAPITGRLERVDLGRGEIALGSTVFRISPGVRVTYQGRPARGEDLLPGQEVSLTVVGGDRPAGAEAVEMAILDPPTQPGYLPPGTRTLAGRARSIGDSEIRVRDETGREDTYSFDRFTAVVRGGKRVGPSEIRPGDRVLLRFQGAEGDKLDRIEVEAPVRLVSSIYRGRLESAFPSTGEVVLKDVRRWYFGSWGPPAEQVKMAVDSTAYLDGRPADLDKLKRDALGQTAFLAAENSYGGERGARLSVIGGPAEETNGPVTQLSFGREEIAVGDDRNPASFGEGTIVVRDGRLTDPFDLDSGEQAFLAVVGGGPIDPSRRRTAAVIEQTSFRSPGDRVYYGKVAKVEERSFALRYYSLLKDNEWPARTTGWDNYQEIGVTAASVITRLAGGTRQPVSIEKFLRTRYSDEFNDQSVYAVVRDGTLMSMLVLSGNDDEFRSQQATIGRVSSADPEKGTVVLTDSKDWSNLNRRWLPNEFPLDGVKLAEALVVGPEGPVEPGEVESGTRVYLLRDASRGVLVFVQ